MDIELRVVGAQQLRGGAHGAGPEPRAGPVRGAAVERGAEDRDGGAADVVEPRQPGERLGPGEPRHDPRVRRALWHPGDAIYPPPGQDYVERSASVGLRRAAFEAGYRPASAPIANPATGAAISAYSGTTQGWLRASA